MDSRTTDAVQDEGDMWPLENGDVLEKGAMPRPGTGAVTEYEELWRDLDVAPAWRRSVVWVLDGRKGMVIRVGEWMEGILRDEMGITVERWEWKVSLHCCCCWGKWVGVLAANTILSYRSRRGRGS